MKKLNGTNDGESGAPPRSTGPSGASSSPSTQASFGTRLSWQQRPKYAAANVADADHVPPDQIRMQANTTTEQELENDSIDQGTSRSQIAQTLGSKDPSWLRQTEDWGTGSAAHRKNRESPRSDIGSRFGSVRLPGMAREGALSLKRYPSPPASSDGGSISNIGSSVEHQNYAQGSQRGSPTSLTSFSQNTSARSPILSPQSSKFGSARLDAPDAQGSTEELASIRPLAMSPSQGRLSPERFERPSSPTKGLGGFVQSAMLKRSDSVNKRWSATSGPALSRGNSILSPRGLEGVRFPIGGATPLAEGRKSTSREGTPMNSSRPGSSLDTFSLQTLKENITPVNEAKSKPDDAGGYSQVFANQLESPPHKKSDSTELLKSPLNSPGKRWSPTKASWLENAISKPESPKIISPPPLQQPAWMANISKAKMNRGNPGNLPKDSAVKREDDDKPSRIQPPKVADKPTILPTPMRTSRTNGDQKSQRAEQNNTIPQPQEEKNASESPPPITLSENEVLPLPDEEAKSQESQPEHPERSEPSQPSRKIKPDTPPRKDFRSSLRSRPTTEAKDGIDQPEFKNVFGKLKKTQTQNYVAPDELKHNILRGKAGLAMTGGPKKSEIRDDFKESILRKKQGMVAPSASSRIVSASSKNQETSIPEAIAKRQGLSRAESQAMRGPAASNAAYPKPASLSSESNVIKEPAVDTSMRPNVESAEKPSNTKATFKGNLAGILQKVPTSVTIPESPTPSPSQLVKASDKDDNAQETLPGAPLTHATKARARGPKRRLPTTAKDTSPEIASKKSQSDLQINPSSQAPASAIRNELNTATETKNSTALRTPMSPNQDHSDFSKPKVAPKPSPKITESSDRDAIKSSSPRTSEISMRKVSPVIKQKPVLSPRASKPTPTSLQPEPKTQKTSPPEEQRSRYASNETPMAEQVGLGIKTVPIISASMRNADQSHSVQPTAAKSPPLLGRKPQSIDRKTTTDAPTRLPIRTPDTSPLKQSITSSQIYADIFDEMPSSKSRVALNTQATVDEILSSVTPSKIKTLRKQISELSDNGKTVPIPPNEEHILFEDALYLCTHVFGTLSGVKTTEVYLWCGDGVSQSAIEDAQLFGRRMTKETGGKLIVLKQGKETPNFFQALGGIVIVRRGSSNRSTTAPYLLCGRQHLGQVAFDEVDCISQSLCTGFPYVLSGRNGKHYLWKGTGARADELGCARLIGMDLGASGEIQEVDEGHESSDFWSSLSSRRDDSHKSRAKSPPWHLKPSCERYATRLFAVDAEPPRPKSSSGFMSWGRRGSAPAADPNVSLHARIVEVTPYTQGDLTDDGIFVLDAFFEIFVYVSLPFACKTVPCFLCPIVLFQILLTLLLCN